MKKVVLTILSFFFLLPVFSPKSAAAQSQIFQLKEAEVHQGDLYAASEKVEISGVVNGDAYLAGGQIFVDGQINGDLLVAGGNINISGEISQDLRAIGGNIVINGIVNRNASLLGGNMEFNPNANILGGLGAAFGNLTLLAPVAGNFKAAGGNLTLGNTVGGDVDAAIGTLRVNDKALVSGNLNYWAGKPASISNSAQILGRTNFHQVDAPQQRNVERWSKPIAQGIKLSNLVITFLLGILFIFFFPQFFSRSVEVLSQKPLISVLWAVVIIFIVIVSFITLLLTLIGIPAAILLMILFGLVLYFSRFTLIYALGSFLWSKFAQTESKIWIWTFGSITYAILVSLPVLRFIVPPIASLMGLGAFFLALRGKKRVQRK